jgi:hypothetical protein
MLHVSRAKLPSVNKNFINLSLSLREHYGGSEREYGPKINTYSNYELAKTYIGCSITWNYKPG